MEFDKIRYDGKRVELEYQSPLEGGGAADSKAHGEAPTPKFKAALAAFTGFVVWVHSWPAEIADRIEVRGVSIKRPDDAPRGIVVTALLKCPRAYGSISTINTPYLAERKDGANGAPTGFLSADVATFVDELEKQATLYFQGERGEQTSLALSENAKEADTRMREASSNSTKKPRAPKKTGEGHQVPGVGFVANPGDLVDISDADVRQLLLSVERDVPVEAVVRWTSSERESAIRWAQIRQKELLGQLGHLAKVPTEPPCVLRDATPALAADNWTATPPRKQPPEALEQAKEEVRRAVESGA